ncbi:NAD-P-binding protein [Peniophora sp. CONT]|nr:NAD-P-binding protein [Peniophora sp. CONT]
MMATALENNGATVYIVGRRVDVLEKAARENNRHGKLLPVQCDITSREDVLALASKVREREGYIDLLVNNAGIVVPTHKPGSHTGDIKELQAQLWASGTAENWARTFDVNVTAVFNMTVAFLDLLAAGNARRAAGEPTSQVITVGSIAGFRRDDKLFSLSYPASKSAVTHLAKSFTGVFKDFKIRSNVIAPGLYPSEMTENLLTDDLVKAGVPLGRSGSANDAAGLILFLASKAGAYVDGTVHFTDGGRLSLFSSTY